MNSTQQLQGKQLKGIGMTSARTRERLVQRLCDEGITNFSVLDIIRNTPRHLFIDEALAHRAYEDSSLPIGHKQTISQPYTVARMTEVLLAAGPRKKVLEIGTGSGYQTAVLAQLVDEVYSVERIKPLQDKAKQRLHALNMYNVQLKNADGSWGWSNAGPYDGILVAAAPRSVPEELKSQLADGGRMVIPLGDDRHQALHLVTREGDTFKTTILESVKFVPFLAGVVR